MRGWRVQSLRLNGAWEVLAFFIERKHADDWAEAFRDSDGDPVVTQVLPAYRYAPPTPETTEAGQSCYIFSLD